MTKFLTDHFCIIYSILDSTSFSFPFDTFQLNTDSSFFHSARDASYWRTLLQNGEWKRYGIYALEAYGIFKIGEMIGRRHVVGYSLEEKPVEVAAH